MLKAMNIGILAQAFLGCAPYAMTFSTETRRPSLHLLLFLFLCLPALPPGAVASTELATLPRSPAISGPARDLWQAGETALLTGNKEKAADLFTQLHRQYGATEKAEEALWQASRLRYELALEQENADWERVRDLYRLFVAEYPKSVRFQEAYLGLGLAHFHMHFYREALVYLNLFLERFPDSALRPEARYWQGRTLVEIGQPLEAEKNYQELAAGADQRLRTKALEALGQLYFTTARFHGALAYYQDLLKNSTPYTVSYFELTRKIGITHARLGHETASQDHLYRYLNVVEDSPHAAAVLFELGESYWRQGKIETARVLYDRTLTRADPQERPAVLSLFRQALYRSMQAKELPPWQRNEDDPSIAGDGLYQAVLDSHAREPIAQDARFALLQRFMVRMEFERAFLLAKNYLNHAAAGDGHQRAVEDILGQLLVERVEKLLGQQEYRQIIKLFQDDSRHMLAYSQGRLLQLVGQAMEALALHEQAGAVYFLALSRELSAAEKHDLDYRRGQVYLAQEDLPSAERLLAHLRDIYQGQPEAAAIYQLSGRLREAQGRVEEGLLFYDQSCRLLLPENRSAACESRVQLLLQLGRLQVADEALSSYRQQDWLEVGARQHLHENLGDAWRRQGFPEQAAAAYVFALEEEAPDGKRAQGLHLRLGDIFLQLGKLRQARIHYERALAGPDSLLRKSAEKGFRQAGIDQSLADLHQAPTRRDGADTR
jgi:tetratricopeptide (TPR) repeat protein